MEAHNVLLLGPIGTGKTSALRTIPDTGRELLVLATEPGIDKILGDLPEDKVHWHYVSPATTDWDTLKQNAKLANEHTMEQLQKLQSPNLRKYQQFIELLDTLADFTCDRCGKNFGEIDDWGPDKVLAIDGLTGISQMSIDLVCGPKPIKSLPEWLCGQDQIKRLIDKLCDDTKCSFVLISHAAREHNELTGGTNLMVSTLGSKLAPKIIEPFDEVILTVRNGKEFHWSTMDNDTDLKTRSLEFSNELTPDFALLFKD